MASPHTHAFGRCRLLGILAAALALVALLPPAPASAHAALVASTPAQGDRLDTLPAEVSFEFDQEMAAPAYVIVTGPDGTSVASGQPEVDGTTVRQRLRDGPAGSYTMAYRAVSKDGHPLAGQVTFTVGAVSPSAAAAGQPSASSEPTAGPVAPPATDGQWSRHTVAVTVGGGLFAAALALLLLSRRAPP